MPSRAQSWRDGDGDVRAWVEAIVDGVRSELGDAVDGVYLHGSLAMGCYHRPKSDLDLLVVSRRPLLPPTRQRLSTAVALHSLERPTVGDLELSVIALDELHEGRHPFAFELHYSETWAPAVRAGTIDWTSTPRDADLAAHLTVTRARGVALLGADPSGLPPIPFEDYVDSIELDLAEIIAGKHLLDSPYYGVLNSCRVLMVRSMGEGCVPSKVEGAAWALEHLDETHRSLIEQALSCYRSRAPVGVDERRTHGHAWDLEALAAFEKYVELAPR